MAAGGEELWGGCNPEEEEAYRTINSDHVENSHLSRHMGLKVTGLGSGRATFEVRL